MGRHIPAVCIVLDIGIEPLKVRIQLRCKAKEQHLALKGPQPEKPGQPLKGRRCPPLRHNLCMAYQFLFNLRDHSADGSRFRGIPVKVCFCSAILTGQEPIGLSLGDHHGMIRLQRVLAPLTCALTTRSRGRLPAGTIVSASKGT